MIQVYTNYVACDTYESDQAWKRGKNPVIIQESVC
ncbi:hypothetical protein Desor_4476 [Desulfosporosinus orientis DSM 765]|uniref:Uncharacterized protein n=1 Tax=Desulfosporosinus orientis (strain ATCC 19365 / DSM 765 / NCIMB 8382 / VKM B-1628 / Singapore I) TaxID=768706 RepID=G7W731_DESOD|nr:hypothetical protein Desor_4476 [Desulfosporosinus orientis DSM 765]